VIGQHAELAQFARRADLVDFFVENQPARGYDSQSNFICHLRSFAIFESDLERIERFERLERKAVSRSTGSNR
jgi:hypothetical protein